jgi:hypothetical protein
MQWTCLMVAHWIIMTLIRKCEIRCQLIMTPTKHWHVAHNFCLFCYRIIECCRKKYMAVGFVFLLEDSFQFHLHLSGVNWMPDFHLLFEWLFDFRRDIMLLQASLGLRLSMISAEISCGYRLLWEIILDLLYRVMVFGAARSFSIKFTEWQKKFWKRRNSDA